jgi:SNF2 family DNA or RNA helicase
LLSHLVERELTPLLVIAPLSTLDHWQNEFRRWAPNLNALLYHGTRESREVIRKFEFLDANDAVKFHVLVTSPNLLTTVARVRGDELKALRLPWRCIVIDEAHQGLKSSESKLADALCDISEHAQMRDDSGDAMRVLVTGTPVQNRTSELVNLLSIIDADARNLDSPADVQRFLAERMLRRTKADVGISLPEMKQERVYVDMPPLQAEHYRALYHRSLHLLDAAPGHAPPLNNLDMQLRKICNHPFLVQGCEAAIEAKHAFGSRLDALLSCSAKFQKLDSLLMSALNADEKMLIFSQFRTTLDLVQEFLDLRGVASERLDGETARGDRVAAMRRFNATNGNGAASSSAPTPSVFLLTTRAGGKPSVCATALSPLTRVCVACLWYV